MTTMRAKVRVESVTPQPGFQQEDLVFVPVGASHYPADGTDEDNTYAKFTPSGKLALCVTNPSLIGQYKVGETYYVDFTPVPDEPKP